MIQECAQQISVDQLENFSTYPTRDTHARKIYRIIHLPNFPQTSVNHTAISDFEM